ncbi:hypothetical protein [Catenulispora subtropica]|uniref:DUF222 domain-containing protein n=1 Tax=Catenulispora subtropica TaxID=450798 RepID=A0ABP5C8D2_9ACTN
MPNSTTAPTGHAADAATGVPAPHAEPGDLLREALRLQELAKAAVEQAAVAERVSGTPWDVIGKVMGITKSSAHTRFAGAVAARNEAAHGPAADSTVAMPRLGLERTWSAVKELVELREVKMGLQTMVGSLSRHTSVSPTDTVETEAPADLPPELVWEDVDQPEGAGGDNTVPKSGDHHDAVREQYKDPENWLFPTCLASSESESSSALQNQLVSLLADRTKFNGYRTAIKYLTCSCTDTWRGSYALYADWLSRLHAEPWTQETPLQAAARRRLLNTSANPPGRDGARCSCRRDSTSDQPSPDDRLAAIERRLAALEAREPHTRD